MKAVISTTYDDKYLYFLPIVTYCWAKLGVDVICFMPKWVNFEKSEEVLKTGKRIKLVEDTIMAQHLNCTAVYFEAPEHKEATYAQCSRLYGACLDLPEDEVLITGDVDMAMFKLPTIEDNGFSVFGNDLVPKGQVPICYLSATVKEWRDVFKLQYGALSAEKDLLATLEIKTYQQCLDELLGEIECDHFRGNYWGKDQEEAYNKIANTNGWVHWVNRAKEGTQFATNRYDRDDSYILDRLNTDTIDFHMNRPGFEDGNFNIILTILKYHYPLEDFTWLIDYTEQYKALL